MLTVAAVSVNYSVDVMFEAGLLSSTIPYSQPQHSSVEVFYRTCRKLYLTLFVLFMWAKCCRFGRELAVSISIAVHLSCSYMPNFSILLTAALADKASSYLLLHSPLENCCSHHKRLTSAFEAPFLPYT